jgi:hypothetical protein
MCQNHFKIVDTPAGQAYNRFVVYAQWNGNIRCLRGLREVSFVIMNTSIGAEASILSRPAQANWKS